MITHMRAQNFKSWRDTGDVRMAPLTVLFGANSSGKTSLLQLLLMLKQTAESPDRSQVLNLGGDERSLVDLGTLPDLLFAGASELQWSLDWDLGETLEVSDPKRPKAISLQGDTLGITTHVAWQGNGDRSLGSPLVTSLRYRFAGGAFGMDLSDPARREYQLVSEHPDYPFVRATGRKWPLPPPAKSYGFPDQVRAYFQNAGFLSDLELQFEQLCARIFYLGPLRDYPRRTYTAIGAQPGDMGRRGERVVDALLAARESGQLIKRGKGKKQQSLEARVAECLRTLGLISHFEVRAVTPGGKLYQVWVRQHAEAPEVLLTDVGFGVSQILPVIALCYYAPRGSTLILEQPEIHLHPKVQAGLADVLIDAIQHQGIQIILESHSEHLLRRLQRRVAEETLAADQAALYFCRLERGESKLTPLELDMFGTIRNWPDGFFGDELGEIAATQLAALDRRTRGGA